MTDQKDAKPGEVRVRVLHEYYTYAGYTDQISDEQPPRVRGIHRDGDSEEWHGATSADREIARLAAALRDARRALRTAEAHINNIASEGIAPPADRSDVKQMLRADLVGGRGRRR
jgi:hypothetical protein